MLTSEQLTYLMDEAKATMEACRKKYDFGGGGVIENEWIVRLDRGRFVIHDKSRNKNLNFSSLQEREVHETVESIVRAFNE